MNAFLSIDLPAVLAATLALVACGTLGNWLVLRKEALAADAIAHAVLPGLVAGYLVTGTRSPWAMLGGAACAGLAAILLARVVTRATKTGASTALGIVFTAFFALGVLLLETQGARQVDLDPSCVLFGSLETFFVVPGADASWFTTLPTSIWTLAAAAAIAIATTVFTFKELAIRAFDPAFSKVSGAAPRWTDDLRLIATTFAIVAAFEAVGSVLVIALVACPALIAAPFARSVRGQIITSLLVSFPIVIVAYFAAAHAERIFHAPHALNASGMIAAFLAAAVPLAHLVHRVVSRDNSGNMVGNMVGNMGGRMGGNMRENARDPKSHDLNRRPA
jgi:manganese/zinc/iron transport system permease protein